jgi:hypothetical protein
MKILFACYALLTGMALAHPADKWCWGIETGYLTQIGHNTPLDYEIIPTQFVLQSPVIFDFWQGESGDRLVVRNRFALIGESFVEGAEDYYIGFSAAPSLEYWFPNQQTALFLTVGGGAGYTNSGDTVGGQGQNFTLNWFAQTGLRQHLTKDMALIVGDYFTHHSNGGQTDPNPGIDVLGATIGLSWSF